MLNIASGIPLRKSNILASLLARSRVEISVEQDPIRQRPATFPFLSATPAAPADCNIGSRNNIFQRYADGPAERLPSAGRATAQALLVEQQDSCS